MLEQDLKGMSPTGRGPETASEDAARPTAIEAPDLFFLHLGNDADHDRVTPRVASMVGQQAEFHLVELNAAAATQPIELLWPLPRLRDALGALIGAETLEVDLVFPAWVAARVAGVVDGLAFVTGADASRSMLWKRVPLQAGERRRDGALHLKLLCPRLDVPDDLYVALRVLPAAYDITVSSPIFSWPERIGPARALAPLDAPTPSPAPPAAGATSPGSLRIESGDRLAVVIGAAALGSSLRLRVNGIVLEGATPWMDAAEGQGWSGDFLISALVRLARQSDPGVDLPLQFALVDGPVEHAAATHEGPPFRARGNIERVAGGAVRGWAAAGPGWSEPIDVTVLVDGVPVHTVSAAEPRADLEKLGIAAGYGGFAFRFGVHPVWPVRAESEVRIRWGLMGQEIAAAKDAMEAPHRTAQRGAVHVALTAIQARRPRVSVIVPVYNAADDVRSCLESLQRYTRGDDVRVIVVDDASPDPAVADVLAAFGSAPRFEIHRNDTNLGFTRTVNRGIALAGDDDVVLLNSDTTVVERWVENLRLAAYSAWNVATVTPLSDNAGPFSVPEPGAPERTAGGDYADVGRLVAKASARLWPEVPTGHGFCLYIRRDCLQAIGGLDAEAFPIGYGEENDFCMRAQRRGFKNIVDDRTFIHHVRSASFGAAKHDLYRRGREVVDRRYPEYTEMVRRSFATPEVSTIRSRVASALAHVGWPAPVRRSILYVISRETGGTPQTNIDLMNGVADAYETYVLKSDNVSVVLERHTSDGREVLETLTLEEPLEITSHRSQAYDVAVSEWLVAYNIDLVHVRHLCWHSLGLFEAAGMLGVPVVMSFHDFYFVCPTIKLLDNELRYCGGTCTEGEGQCRVELWKTRGMPTLKHRWVHAWRGLFRHHLAACAAFVTTSPYARQVILEAFPELPAERFSVISHGRDFPRFARAGRTPAPGEPLRIIVPGNIGPAKGSDLLKAVKALDTANALDIHIVGNTDKSLSEAGITLHGTYERENATEIFARLSPHVGAILSIWPETYCHTLTELWSAGIPVLGFDIGAVGERIAEHKAGWLMPVATPEAVYAYLLKLRADAEAIARATRAVHAWQDGEGSHYAISDMAAAYRRVYAHAAGWSRTGGN